MRNLVLALLSVGGLALAGVASAHAAGTRHPFCIQGNDFPGLSGCTFDSYEQCQATASGRFLYCMANPYFDQGRPYPAAYRGRHRVRSVYPAY